MNFIEFVGFIITMIAMIWVTMRRARETSMAQQVDMEGTTNEDKEQLREFMKMLNIEVEEVESKVQAPPPPIKKSKVEAKPKPQEKRPPLEVHRKPRDAYLIENRPSRIKRIVNALPLRKQIIVIREVLSPPKGLE